MSRTNRLAEQSILERARLAEGPLVLWTLGRRGHVVECRLALQPLHAELRIACDGAPLMAYTFGTPSEALLWAEEDRQQLLVLGWAPVEPKPGGSVAASQADERSTA